MRHPHQAFCSRTNLWRNPKPHLRIQTQDPKSRYRQFYSGIIKRGKNKTKSLYKLHSLIYSFRKIPEFMIGWSPAAVFEKREEKTNAIIAKHPISLYSGEFQPFNFYRLMPSSASLGEYQLDSTQKAHLGSSVFSSTITW